MGLSYEWANRFVDVWTRWISVALTRCGQWSNQEGRGVW